MIEKEELIIIGLRKFYMNNKGEENLFKSLLKKLQIQVKAQIHLNLTFKCLIFLDLIYLKVFKKIQY